MDKQHYVYYSYEPWGRGYIGVRSCNGDPEKDIKYFGSFLDKNFKPTEKIILHVFKTRKEANNAEIALHEFYSVASNPHFANRANSTSSGFSRLGAKNSETAKKKVAMANKGNKYCLGRKVSDEAKEKIRQHNIGRKKSKETIEKLRSRSKGDKNPMHGKTHSQTAKNKISLASKERWKEQDHPMKGKTHTDNARQKISKAQKKIGLKLIFCKTGEIKEFNSQLEAAKSLNLHQGSISSLLKGKIKTTGGWKVYQPA